MHLKNILNIAFIITVVFIIAFGTILYSLIRENSEVAEMETNVARIIREKFELNIIADQYLIQTTDRLEKQWQLKYKAFDKFLKNIIFTNRNYQDIIEKILNNLENEKIMFNLIVESNSGPNTITRSKNSLDNLRISILEEEILLKSQSTILLVFQLEELIKNHFTQIQQKITSSIIMMLVSISLLIISIILWTKYKIINPLQILEKGTLIVGRGNLQHKTDIRSKNEIGNLSKAFDEMTANLYRSVTELKRAEMEIKEALHEKEILIQDIHHRVKNNLMLISSLLLLQKNKLAQINACPNDFECLLSLNDIMHRINVLSNIYEYIYQNKRSVEYIQCDSFFSKLLDMVMTFNLKEKSIKINKNISNIQLHFKKVVPVSLIINEIISNIFKHAFNNLPDGRIDFSLKAEKGIIKLNISDNGNGMAKDPGNQKKTSMGLTLIDAFVTQLDGEYKIETHKGVSYDISFKM